VGAEQGLKLSSYVLEDFRRPLEDCGKGHAKDPK
jgi:hypothetical protein